MSNRKAFVIMPFSEELHYIYEFLIKEALQDAGYAVFRANDIASQRNILDDIVKGISESDIVVADLTGSNPNVYYELGIAHTLQKKVILLTQDIDELPFDLRSYRVFSYGTHFKHINQAKKDLSELARKAIDDKLLFGNPIKDFGNMISVNVASSKEINDFLSEKFDNDLGIFDYFVDLEEGFEKLTQIVMEVSKKLSNELTPKINDSTEKLNSQILSTRYQRNIIRNLAKHIQEFGKFLQPRNRDYRVLLTQVETTECVKQNETRLS